MVFNAEQRPGNVLIFQVVQRRVDDQPRVRLYLPTITEVNLQPTTFTPRDIKK